eukprot:3891178-Amphidinium_carterae.1
MILGIWGFALLAFHKSCAELQHSFVNTHTVCGEVIYGNPTCATLLARQTDRYGKGRGRTRALHTVVHRIAE